MFIYGLCSYGIYGYGLYSRGLHGYGLYSHGLRSYGPIVRAIPHLPSRRHTPRLCSGTPMHAGVCMATGMKHADKGMAYTIMKNLCLLLWSIRFLSFILMRYIVMAYVVTTMGTKCNSTV